MVRENRDNSATIFISIASYRDPELLPTLQDMLRHAAHPENLHIAICWQDNEERNVFEQAGLEPAGSRTVAGNEVFAYRYHQARIDVVSVHYYASRGACWARNLAERLFDNESFFLQIDSHCRFVPNWDEEMIAMLRQLRATSSLPIISSYPPAFTPGENEEASKNTYVSRLIFREYNTEGIPMLRSTPFEATAPIRGSYLAGGFIFTDGGYVRSIPNDPQIFFAGEEIAMAVRAFTHGYDIYHPHKPLLWHYYQRKEHNKIWGDHTNQAKDDGVVEKAWWEWDSVSKKRVRTLLGLESENAASLAPYMLGSRRSLRQFEYQAGICLKNGTVLPEVMGPELTNFFPVPPTDEKAWFDRQYAYHKKAITLNASEYSSVEQDMNDLHLSVYNKQNVLLYKRTLGMEELEALRKKSPNDGLVLSIEFKTASAVHPAVVRICPWSTASGWGTITEKAW
ncbi:Glycosyltransferase (GlcNAc) [Serratia quinivorans]|uniref:UDP-N-acetylglucosamine-transferase n=1 Tax=Serratia quinivorans TaxID=137545 RepID=UPI0021798AA3|nr:UDP-N-acetylglucosamine-transferase [Serratia quinivorans]CAI1572184.1 Glycosyltransferase (GlcNAc) [Serratia quinivorans]